jgi:hypothetical protein
MLLTVFLPFRCIGLMDAKDGNKGVGALFVNERIAPASR